MIFTYEIRFTFIERLIFHYFYLKFEIDKLNI
jgi:hypothetical protein